MKKLFIFIISVLGVVAIADIVSGIVLDRYTRTHRLPGDLAPIDYMLKEADQDVIIVGNSAILNSLMPSVVSDSTGYSVYNGASNGQSLPFFHTMVDAILNRYTPKAIVIGLQTSILRDKGPGERYNILSPYYRQGYVTIDSCFESASTLEPYLLKSTFYRYNNIWFRILLYHLTDRTEHTSDGFIAKPSGGIQPDIEVLKGEGSPTPQRIAELRTILEKCRQKDVRVIIMWPPEYRKYTSERQTKKAVEHLVREFDNVCVIDDSADSLFLASPQFFFDNLHLNADGALIYSKSKATQLRQYLCEKS